MYPSILPPTNQGMAGMYRGLGATLMVSVPNLAISFSMYETLKERRELELEAQARQSGKLGAHQEWDGQVCVYEGGGSETRV